MKMKDRSALFRLAEYAGSHRKLLWAGGVCSAVSAVLSLLPFVCIWFVARDALLLWRSTGDAGNLMRWGWLAVGFAGGAALFYLAALLCTHIAAFRTARNLRFAALSHVISLPLGFFAAGESGRLRKQINDNAELTESLLAHQLPDLIGAVATPLAAAALLFVFDWRMGLICLIPMIAAFLILARMLGGDNSGFFSRYQQKLEEMSGEAVEYIRGIPVVKVFQQTVRSFRNFHRIILEYRELAEGYALSCRTPMTLFLTVLNGAFVLLIPVGMVLAASTGEGWEGLLNFIFYLLFAPACAVMMARVMYASEAVMQAGEAVRKLDELLANRPLPEPETPRLPAGNAVCFDDVTFCYDGAAKPALSGVSFEVAEGKSVALVGRSGGGKTTAATLVPRFRDVASGAVRIGGADVREIAPEELMKRVSFVFQDVRLFKATLRENVRCSKPGASDAEVTAALEAARGADILAKLPEGLDSMIGGENGVRLSGGEMQRVALARAILKDAPIVVLDEATAFADPENEHLIRQALEILTRGRTVLTIAHRLNNVCSADEILVFDGGTVVERGTHDGLLEKNGVYAELWNEYRSSVGWKVGKESASSC